MIDIRTTILPWLGISAKLIDYYIKDCFTEKNIDLTKVQWILLMRLKEENGLPQNSLAFITNRDKATLTRLLTTMEKKNLVARIPSDTDHRVNRIYITARGEKILKEAQLVIQDIIRDIERGITEEEKETVTSTLKKVIHNIKSDFLLP